MTKKMNLNKVLSERNIELKDSLDLKDFFSVKRQQEKMELVMIRQKFALELLNVRDDIACKRHKERLSILSKKI